MKCHDCGKEFFGMEGEHFCDPCRLGYNLEEKSWKYLSKTEGFGKPKGRDIYSERLREGFRMMGIGSYNE